MLRSLSFNFCRKDDRKLLPPPPFSLFGDTPGAAAALAAEEGGASACAAAPLLMPLEPLIAQPARKNKTGLNATRKRAELS